jgi:hypothetical protein
MHILICMSYTSTRYYQLVVCNSNMSFQPWNWFFATRTFRLWTNTSIVYEIIFDELISYRSWLSYVVSQQQPLLGCIPFVRKKWNASKRNIPWIRLMYWTAAYTRELLPIRYEMGGTNFKLISHIGSRPRNSPNSSRRRWQDERNKLSAHWPLA